MTRLIIGAMVRAIGAYPSGWRYPGAHRDPRGDAAVLRRAAEVAEAARLDYLFFGDWLATGHDLEFRDPYLVARIDPISAITYLAGITSRIGLIATANMTYADPYTLARATASIDLLSGGRAGLNLVTGAEPRAAGNHGRDHHQANDTRYDRAVEFELVLRRLWDSFEDDAIVADAASGVYLDPTRLHATDFHGTHLSVTGPLNVARPVQGHLPIVHAGTSPRSRLFAAQNADLALVAVSSLEHGVAIREELRALAFESGRDDRTLKVIAPVLPIVGETRGHAQAIADELSELVQIAEDWPGGPPEAFPANRSLAQLSTLVGVDVAELSPDRGVTPSLVAQFSPTGQELVEIVAERTGRKPRGGAPADPEAPRGRGIRERVDGRGHGRRDRRRVRGVGRSGCRRRVQRALCGAARAVRGVRVGGGAGAAATRRVPDRVRGLDAARAPRAGAPRERPRDAR